MTGVHIVALAARTPVGLQADTTAAAVRGGISRISEHPIFVDARGKPVLCGRDARLEPTLIGVQRMAELARSALLEISLKLTMQRPYKRPVSLFLALPEPRPGFDGSDARWLLQTLGRQHAPGISRLAVVGVGEGHAGAL